MFKTIKRVAIFGDGEAKETDQHYRDAYETAKLLAENGYIMVNGGGPGVMLAATLGAKAGNGKVEIVMISGRVKMDNYEGQCKRNVTVADKKYSMESYEKRLNKLIEIADAFVVFKGGTGTIAELGMVWSRAKFDYGHEEPVILFGKFWEEIMKTLDKKLGLEKIEEKTVKIVEKPEEVIRALKLNGVGN